MLNLADAEVAGRGHPAHYPDEATALANLRGLLHTPPDPLAAARQEARVAASAREAERARADGWRDKYDRERARNDTLRLVVGELRHRHATALTWALWGWALALAALVALVLAWRLAAGV